MDPCPCEVTVKVGGCCYYCAKLRLGLIGYGRNGTDLSDEQRRFVGVENPSTIGATWVSIAEPLSKLLTDAPVEGWERLVPTNWEWS